MASVAWQGLSGFVQTCVAAVQASARAVVDATVGSVTLAWSQAIAGTALFLQGQAAEVTALSRLATCFGAAVDSFVNQFGFYRLGATYATTTETFARFTPSGTATIIAGTGSNGALTGGAVVSTGPGGIQFMVAADPTNPLWDAAVGGYVLPDGTASVTVPVQCLAAGAVGNVLAGTITSFFTPIAGIDTCSNAAAPNNGLDEESDAAVKTRFQLYWAGLGKANKASIESAIAGIQQNIQCELIENRMPIGSAYAFYDDKTFFDSPGTLSYPALIPWPGRFFAVVDDGTGSPSAALLAAAASAVAAVRGFAIQYNVVAPIKETPSVELTIEMLPRYPKANALGPAQNAVSNFLAASTLKSSLLSRTKIADAVYAAVPGIKNIPAESILINGVAADLVLTPMQVYKPGGGVQIN